METSVYNPQLISVMAEQQQSTLTPTTQPELSLLLLQILHLVQDSQLREMQDNSALSKARLENQVENQRYDDLQFVCNSTSEMLHELRNRIELNTKLKSELVKKEFEIIKQKQDLSENKRQHQEQKVQLEFEKSTRQKHLQQFLKELREKTHIISETHPLSNAVQENNIDLVQLLLYAGEDVEDEDDGHRRPIHYACWNGSLELVKLLASYGANLTAENEDSFGDSPINIAIYKDHTDMLVWLLDNGLSVNKKGKFDFTPLLSAAFYDKLDMAKLLLDRGADVHSQTSAYSKYNAIQIAVHRRNAEMVRLLIEKGADIEARANHGETPLALAAKNGDLETVKFLVEHGADVSAIDLSGQSVKQLALMGNNKDVAKYLGSIS